MAVIPNPSSRQRVGLSPTANVPTRNPGIAEQGLVDFGKGVSSATASVMRKMGEERDRIETRQAQDAYNETVVLGAQLTSGQEDPENGLPAGYNTIKGANASDPDENGKALNERYLELLNNGSETISGKLTGKAKEKYDLKFAQFSTNFQVGMLGHMGDQSLAQQEATDAATLATAGTSAAIHHNNPGEISNLLQDVSGVVRQSLDRKGLVSADVPEEELSPSEKRILEGATQEATSVVHSGVIDGFISEGGERNLGEAAAWLDIHKGGMTTDAVKRARALIDNGMEEQASVLGGKSAVDQFAHQVMPTTVDRAKNISNQYTPGSGDDFEELLRMANGNEEQAWAMQRMVSKGLTPAKAEKAIRMALQRESETGVPWLDSLPAKVKAYVEPRAKLFNTGGGVSAPSINAVKAAARESLLQRFPDARPSVIKAAEDAAVANIANMQDEVQTQQENAMSSVKRLVDAGQMTSTSKIPPDLKALLGDDVGTINRYIKSTKDAADRWHEGSLESREIYNAMASDPELLITTPARDIYNLSSTIGTKYTNDLLDLKYKLENDPASFEQAKVDSDLLSTRMQKMGVSIGRGGKGANKKHKILNAVKHAIVEEQVRLGVESLTSEQKSTIIDRQLTKIVIADDTDYVYNFGRKVLLEDIPEEFVKSFVAQYKEAGVGYPTNRQVIVGYINQQTQEQLED